jgi:low temperature requirement protein LtrA
MAEAQTWWRRPELRDDQRRSVGWLELFFDLVFVVVVSRLAHYLAGNLTPRAVLEFTIQFAGVFWIWNAFTYYTERFESGGLEDRFFTFLALLPVAGLAVFAEGGLAEHHDEFAIAYLAARAVNMIGWVRAARNVEAFRPVAKRFLIGFAVPAVLILISMESGPNERLWLWGIAVLIDVLTPSLTMRQQAKLPPISMDRFPERFGLFTLIVLGESLVGVITAISALSDADGLRRSTWLTAPFGLAIGFGLWWLYFDFVARRPPRQQVTNVLVWVYLHLLAVTMIAVTGAGISLAIVDDAEGALDLGSQRLVATGVGGALIAVALLETTLIRRRDEPTHPLMSPFLKIATGSLALLAGWAAEQWSTTALFVLLLTAIVIPCAYGALVWFAPARTNAIADPDFLANASVDGPPPSAPPPVPERKIPASTEPVEVLPMPPEELPLPPADEPAPPEDGEPAPSEDGEAAPTEDEGSGDEKREPAGDEPTATGTETVATAERTSVKVESPPPTAPKRSMRSRRK